MRLSRLGIVSVSLGLALCAGCARKAPKRLHLTVRAIDGSPLAGVRIVVLDSAGAIELRATTGSNGTSILDVTPDSSVTVVHDYEGAYQLESQMRTFTGVRNG